MVARGAATLAINTQDCEGLFLVVVWTMGEAIAEPESSMKENERAKENERGRKGRKQ